MFKNDLKEIIKNELKINNEEIIEIVEDVVDVLFYTINDNFEKLNKYYIEGIKDSVMHHLCRNKKEDDIEYNYVLDYFNNINEKFINKLLSIEFDKMCSHFCENIMKGIMFLSIK